MMLRASRRTFVGGALLAPLILAGCGAATDAEAPPAITYDRDTCARCGMIISDERYAGGLVAEDGTARLFDDVGEMLQSVRESGLNGQRAWAHDWGSRDWIDATTAIFVKGDPKSTPMGTGIVAFASRDAADAYIAEQGGTAMTWEEAIAPKA
ncbi:MAG: nitrous oxide reductase accessory protein NosL [Thermomicrobiales bacterium]|nr:nitrous oxide reductase accessory protein NosL [Thermomicrobiales bacterium]